MEKELLKSEPVQRVEPHPSVWQYVGPDDITKIILGDKTYDVKTMPQEAIESLRQQYPTYAAWFKKV